METSTLLTLVTIFISIVFGIPAFISLRQQSKTKIFFFEQQKINLYDDLLKNIPNLSIAYNGEAIEKTMFLLKGIFICSGKKDIVAADIQKGILIQNKGANSKWLDFNIIGKTQNLEVNLTNNGDIIELNFNLLKDKDYFVIKALGESEDVDLAYNHRIANVQSIDANSINKAENSIWSIILGLFSICFTMFIWSMGGPFSQVRSYDLDQKYYTQSGVEISRDILQKIMEDDHNREFHALLNENKLGTFPYQSLYSITDSLKNRAVKARPRYSFFIHNKTQKYHVYKSYMVEFKLENLGLFELIFGTIFLVIGLFIVMPNVIYYFTYRKITKIANQRLLSVISD